MFQLSICRKSGVHFSTTKELDPIKDPHRKAVTAVLLENQEKFLKEQSAFNDGNADEQPTNQVGNGGFSGYATASVPTAGFDPVLISLIRRSMPNLIAYDSIGVQPMSNSTGLIFAMRSRYQNQSGSEAFFNEADSAFSGQPFGRDDENNPTDGTAGMGTTSQDGVNPAALTLSVLLTPTHITLDKVCVPTPQKHWTLVLMRSTRWHLRLRKSL